MCEIMQRYMSKEREEGRAEGRSAGITKMAENLRGYGLSEEQIAEFVRKSSEDTAR